MTEIFGTGDFRYEAVPDWGRLPEGWSLKEVAAVAVDSQDRVYAFSRGEHPICVFDRDGNFLTSWGEGLFSRAHGLHMGPDDSLWCTDDGDHTVRKCTLDGRVLLTIGLPGRPAPYMSGQPFNRCTHTALSPEGDIYVSDGYGNAAVHKYSPEGKHLFSWGRSGDRAGRVQPAAQHRLRRCRAGLCRRPRKPPHPDLRRQGPVPGAVDQRAPALLAVPRQGQVPLLLCGRAGAAVAGEHRRTESRAAHLGARHAGQGAVAFRQLGGEAGQFWSPHGIAVDSCGDLYVGEVSFTAWPRYHDGAPPPPEGVRCLQKYRRVT